MVVRNRLKYYRDQYKMTQQEFAELLEVSQTQYNKWETHKINLSIKNAYYICKILKIKLDDLFYDDEETT